MDFWLNWSVHSRRKKAIWTCTIVSFLWLQSYLHIPHPVVCPQLVPVDDVRGNDYNPNQVAPPEMRLLEIVNPQGRFHHARCGGPATARSMSWWMVFIGGRWRTDTGRGYLPSQATEIALADIYASSRVEARDLLLRNHSWTNEEMKHRTQYGDQMMLWLKQMQSLAEMCRFHGHGICFQDTGMNYAGSFVPIKTLFQDRALN